jgi:hypothetical protein
MTTTMGEQPCIEMVDDFCMGMPDDNDPIDGCLDCKRVRTIFVTSTTYKGFELGGLDGADAKCAEHAASLGEDPKWQFKAWLGTGDESPAERLPTDGQDALPLHRPADGALVATSWKDLTEEWWIIENGFWSYSKTKALDNPINITEKGVGLSPGDTRVWTGSAPDGYNLVANCGDWSQATVGLRGDVQWVDHRWSDDGWVGCAEAYHLICVQNFE